MQRNPTSLMLLGAMALGSLLSWACGDLVPEAKAHDGTSSTCHTWKVKGFFADNIRKESVTTTEVDGSPRTYTLLTVDEFELPDGWQPFGGEALGSILARKCAD